MAIKKKDIKLGNFAIGLMPGCRIFEIMENDAAIMFRNPDGYDLITDFNRILVYSIRSILVYNNLNTLIKKYKKEPLSFDSIRLHVFKRYYPEVDNFDSHFMNLRTPMQNKIIDEIAEEWHTQQLTEFIIKQRCFL